MGCGKQLLQWLKRRLHGSRKPKEEDNEKEDDSLRGDKKKALNPWTKKYKLAKKDCAASTNGDNSKESGRMNDDRDNVSMVNIEIETPVGVILAMKRKDNWTLQEDYILMEEAEIFPRSTALSRKTTEKSEMNSLMAAKSTRMKAEKYRVKSDDELMVPPIFKSSEVNDEQVEKYKLNRNAIMAEAEKCPPSAKYNVNDDTLMAEEAKYPPNATSSMMETIEEEEDDLLAEFEIEDKIEEDKNDQVGQ